MFWSLFAVGGPLGLQLPTPDVGCQNSFSCPDSSTNTQAPAGSGLALFTSGCMRSQNDGRTFRLSVQVTCAPSDSLASAVFTDPSGFSPKGLQAAVPSCLE